MFANFTLSTEGLVDSNPRSKPNASRTGCLTCRRKKKKCDAEKPVCGRCRNSYGQDACLWPIERRKQRSRSRQSQENDRISPPSSPDSSRSTSQEVIKTTRLRENEQHLTQDSRIEIGFENFCLWNIPHAVAKISPDLSPRALLDISTAFQTRVLCLDKDFKESLIIQSLPLALKHPALLHAWVACSVIALSRSTPYWHEKAIRHYDSAVSGLNQALQTKNHASEKWKRETVILLHLFEGFQSKSDESALGKVHLQGAHELFNPTLEANLPMSYHEVLVLEAYIMHTTNNCLFQPDGSLAFNHISQALQTLQLALERLKLPFNWRNCPWIGFMGPDLVDIIYKTSILTHSEDLDDECRKQEIRYITSALSNWTAPAISETSTSEHLDLPPRHLVLLAKAYWCACSYLITTLFSDSLGTSIPTNDLLDETLRLIREVMDCDSAVNNHLWPLLIIGTAAEDEETRERVRDLLQRFEKALGIESVKRAERFLTKAWCIGWDGKMVAYRIFRDKEVLCRMFF